MHGGTAGLHDTTPGGQRSMLRPLSALAEGGEAGRRLPDVRGRRVRTRAGSDIGEVTELLVDPERRPRYLVVTLHRAFVDTAQHRVLVPIGIARVDEAAGQVIVEAGAGCIVGAPPFLPGRMDGAYERALLGRFGWRDPAPGERIATDVLYGGPLFDDRLFVGAPDGGAGAPGGIARGTT